ncbi:MAG: winged helix-turn-helix domain-containing protein, partial [Anaerolineales bacterium]|nr:winged helix-turn-helix domain-containing protein [Anaerolineales bacterium]
MSRFRLHLLGAYHATLDGVPLTAFGTDKARALLAYLVLEAPRPHTRTRLAGLLWPDQPEARALHSLRQALSQLRKLLRDGDGDTFLLIDRDAVQFNGRSRYWLDVHAFQQHRAAAQQHGARWHVRHVQQAVALYTDPLLDEFLLDDAPLFDEWAMLWRETLQRQALELLEWLLAYHERRGAYALGRGVAERLVTLAP